MSFEVGIATADELKELINWAFKEQWSPAKIDAEILVENFLQHAYIGRLDGKMVSGVVFIPHGTTLVWVGLYIVHSEHRGKGFGFKTFQFATEDSKKYANGSFGLAGVLQQVII